MAKASPEIIKIAEQYTLDATHRLPDKIGENGIHDEISDFTCFHTTPKPPNRDLESFIQNMRDYQAKGQIANSYDFNSDGWVVGDVAWVISELKGVFPDGYVIDVRTTTVLRHVNNQWKVAHLHLSEPVVGAQHMTPKS
ncbi:MAG: nuclear transport factor 2 family protein [Oscillibacter sp.]|jgi:hypothetical protein|nr:nuclear transport factor 2 family protein [Oscillibacter sp.]